MADWPFFRGPDMDGIIKDAEVPEKWGEGENVMWQVEIHDRGWSSPVVYGDQIWLTTATTDGTKLYGVCIDAISGRTIFDRLLFEVEDPQYAHKFNSYASPTGAAADGFVYLTFGSPGIACIDTKKLDVVWKRDDIECDHFRGAGSSLTLYKDMILTHYDGADHQFVTALSCKNGDTVWSTPRSVDFRDLTPDGKPSRDGDFRKGYSTPYIVTEPGGKDVMLSLGSKAGYGYDPDSGKELWRVDEPSAHSGTGVPVVGDNLIYYVSGFAKGMLYSIPLGARGELSEKDFVWKTKRNVANKPSPIYYDGYIFMIDDGGIASCLDAKSGKEMWRERIGGNHSASPLIAHGKIFFWNEEGIASVVEAGPEFSLIATNKLGSGFMSTQAVYHNDWILRSKTHLYRITQK